MVSIVSYLDPKKRPKKREEIVLFVLYTETTKYPGWLSLSEPSERILVYKKKFWRY